MTELSMAPLILIHMAVSLVSIVAGLVVVAGMIRDRRADRWSAWFLGTTLFTSASGFVLPAAKFMPTRRREASLVASRP